MGASVSEGSCQGQGDQLGRNAWTGAGAGEGEGNWHEVQRCWEGSCGLAVQGAGMKGNNAACNCRNGGPSRAGDDPMTHTFRALEYLLMLVGFPKTA